MERWYVFFTGELTAASAFAGLLFVSLSVNQARILEIERLADRGLEGLILLLLVVAMASFALIPTQPPRLAGAEMSAAGALTLFQVLRLQRLYMPLTGLAYRARARRLTWMSPLAVGAITFGGACLALSGDLRSLYVVPLGVLLCFVAAGTNAWVLLIEINR